MLSRRRFVIRSSVAAVGSLGVVSTGFSSALETPGLRRVTLVNPALPAAWDGLTLLQVADVHAGVYMTVERMRQISAMISRLPVDAIVFTGDQIDRRLADAGMFSQGFRGLSAPLGVFGILGNHDHYVGRTLAESALTAAGIVPLINRSVTFRRRGAELTLVGVDDPSSIHGGPDFSLLARHRASFRICLCHQPQCWPDARSAGAHLTLSGHTHGGQIALPTRNVNVARLTTRYVAGPYRQDGSLLYVSRGIGVGAVPIRLGAPPEIDVITLRTGAASPAAAA